MNRGKFYFFIFVAVILGMVTLQLQLQKSLIGRGTVENAAKPSVESLIKSDSPSSLSTEKSPEQKKWDESVTPEFLEQLKQESEQVGLPQQNIQDLEKRLQSWARHLDEKEIDYLSAVVKDRTRNGDERALALDLLGRNQSTQSLNHLKEFVLTEGAVASPSRAHLDEEMILKVQAVEGIAASSSSAEAMSYLSEIEKKSEQSFVKDRAQRSLSSLKGLAPSPESQDNEALKKMIK